MNAMNNQEAKAKGEDKGQAARNGVAGENNVDQEIPFAIADYKELPAHPSQSKPWLFKPGQSGNPAGRGSTIKLKAAFLHHALDKNDERMHEIITHCLKSDDLAKWRFAFDFTLGQIKDKVDISAGEGNEELMRIALRSYEGLKQENAEMKAELEKKTIDIK